MSKRERILRPVIDAVTGASEVLRGVTQGRSHVGGRLQSTGAALHRFVPSAPQLKPFDQEASDVWGFKDTAFRLNARGNVELSGTRYALSGSELPNLLPWIRGIFQTNVGVNDLSPGHYPTAIPPSRASASLKEALGAILSPDQVSDEPQTRLRHGHGHTQGEMYAIKYGQMPRVPDLVLFPESEEQVASIVELAKQLNASLIPYGGGTNVTDALVCPEQETRTILSVDMQRLNRILWIDPVNRMACIQAGAVGRHIMQQLAEHGFTMGHEPDSVEFSTLGGWIATHASGMKKNKYGNIEDLVLDMSVVTAMGKLERSSVAPRESVGFDPKQLLFGSEGSLGIITSAVVKLFPLPEVQHYGSVLFPSFEEGVGFMYEITRSNVVPASVRLVDNLQFQFSLALKPASTGWKKQKSALEKLFVTRVKGFDPKKMVACTLVFEGRREEVERQEEALYAIAARFGGMKAGSENGERGYQLTYGIAYIRDFVMRHQVIAESFETSVPWSQILSLCENVKRKIYEEHDRRKLPGKPFVTARVTQVYETGAAVYFYYAFHAQGVTNPSGVYHEIENLARAEILRSGGSLSHHHGIGKLRQSFLPDIHSPAALGWAQQAKQALDPQNVFGSGNQVFSEPQAPHSAVRPAVGA